MIKLFLVIPCYKEQEVLPETSARLKRKMQQMIEQNRISPASRVVFVNDGSTDKTWELILELSKKDNHFVGISQSRNFGHQNAVLAGLMEARSRCHITITMDCDGQDDFDAIDEMIYAYQNGYEVVYGVRSNRKKRFIFKKEYS